MITGLVILRNAENMGIQWKNNNLNKQCVLSICTLKKNLRWFNLQSFTLFQFIKEIIEETKYVLPPLI